MFYSQGFLIVTWSELFLLPAFPPQLTVAEAEGEAEPEAEPGSGTKLVASLVMMWGLLLGARMI